MTTSQAGPGTGPASIPEPALRPVEGRFPDRAAARRARVYVDRSGPSAAIVIRDPRGRQRRIAAGHGGATRVVLEPAVPGGGLLGSVVLRGEAGQVLASFPRAYWQPEAPDDESLHDAGRPADDAAAFASATGLPVADERQAGQAAPAAHRGGRDTVGPPRRPAGPQAGVVAFRTALPAWFLIARALLAAAAAGLLIAILIYAESTSGKTGHSFATDAVYQALALACAAAVLAQPLLAGVPLARAWLLDRASGLALPEPSATLAPRPGGHAASAGHGASAGSAPASERFLRTASLRLFPADLVVTSEAGEERWLPRTGPTGVTELARVTAGGRPSRLELRTADGRPRAVLPWAWWFAGAGGEQALAGFAAAAGLPVREAEGPHIPEGAETIWRYRPLRFPTAAAEARSLRWRGLPGSASVGIPVIYGIFTAIVGAASPPALALAALAVVVSAGSWLALRLARRRRDRPAPRTG
jgi:hypothetical protein